MEIALRARAHARVPVALWRVWGGRSAAREVGKVLGFEPSNVDRMAKLMNPFEWTDPRDTFERHVRELERRIQQEGALACEPGARPEGDYDFPAKVSAMNEVMVLALQCDATRVISFMIGKEQSARPYPQIGVPEAHHPLSHHGNDPEKIARMAKINAFHVSLFAEFLQKLKETPDGDGSLLDHSLLFYGGGMSDGQAHSPHPLPLIALGGAGRGLRGGRHVVAREWTPIANLWLAVADLFGARDPETIVFGQNMTSLTFSVSRAIAREWREGDEIIGKTIRDADFRATYGAAVVAVHRGGKRVETKIGDIVLRPGDTFWDLGANAGYHTLMGARAVGPTGRVIAVEPAACPSLTKGLYAFDFGDTGHLTPLVKMHTLGSEFIPPGFHAGGLRYHGMAPLVSHLVHTGLVEARAYPQSECFAEAVRRGAKVAREPYAQADSFGRVRRAKLRAYGDTLHSLVSLDDYRGDGRGVVEQAQALEVVGELDAAVQRLAPRERIARKVVGMPDVIDAGKAGPEHLAVGGNAADRHAAEVDAVVAALAADEAKALTFTTRAVPGEGDLERRVDRFGARVGEEHPREALRGDARQALGELEGDRVAHLEGRREVHLPGLPADGLDDARPGMAGVHAPQPGDRVEHLAPLGRPVVHALGAGEKPRRALELPVGSKGHPEGRPFRVGPLIDFDPFVHRASIRLGGVGDHLLALLAQARYAQRHHVARLEEHGGGLDAHADARRGTRGDDVSRQQRHVVADMGNDLRHVENHGAGVAALHAPAVDVEPHVERLRVAPGGVVRVVEAATLAVASELLLCPNAVLQAGGDSMPCFTSSTRCSFLGPHVRCSRRSASTNASTASAVRCGKLCGR